MISYNYIANRIAYKWLTGLKQSTDIRVCTQYWQYCVCQYWYQTLVPIPTSNRPRFRITDVWISRDEIMFELCQFMDHSEVGGANSRPSLSGVILCVWLKSEMFWSNG